MVRLFITFYRVFLTIHCGLHSILSHELSLAVAFYFRLNAFAYTKRVNVSLPTDEGSGLFLKARFISLKSLSIEGGQSRVYQWNEIGMIGL